MGSTTKAGLGGLTLFFYTQIVGLDAPAVSLAIFIALLIDAFWDPLVGQFSDNTTSLGGWDAATCSSTALAIPASLFFAATYMPPMGWPDEALFFYLLGTIVLGRLFESLVEIPLAALLPELSRDYDQRTSLGSWRYVFLAVVGRAVATFLTFGIFLRGTKSQPFGQAGTRRAGRAAGHHGGVDRAGLRADLGAGHPALRALHAPGAGQAAQLRRDAQRGAHRASPTGNFVSLALSGMIFGIAVGISGGLQTYFYTYYWELPSTALLALGIWGIPGGLAGVIVAPYLSRVFGKKRAALTTFFMSIFCVTLPITARLIGIMPPNSSPWVLRILIIDSIATGLFSIIGFVIVTAMLADVVEEAQVKSGKRSEGVLFAADSLLRKITTSFASIFPGLILAYVGLSKAAKPGHVDPAILSHMAIIYLPVVTTLYLCLTSCIMLYRIDRQRHESNLETIAEAALLAEESDPEVNPHPA